MNLKGYRSQGSSRSGWSLSLAAIIALTFPGILKMELRAECNMHNMAALAARDMSHGQNSL